MGGRVGAVQQWLARHADTAIERLALAWVILATISMACAVFAPVWADWLRDEGRARTTN